MNKYKVEFLQTERFIIDILAQNEAEARELAEKEWGKGNCQETGDCGVSIGEIYDVTDTDDPFNP